MFPIAFIVLVGFVGSILTIYEFINSRIGNSPRRSQLLALVFGGATVVMIIGSLLFGNILSPSGNNGSPTLTNVTSTPENKTTPTTGFTPIPTSSLTQPTLLSPTQTPITPTPTVQSILPYIADWSHGPNGWPVTDLWRVYGNALHCSGAGDIAFPFQLEPGQSGTTDYTVEWKATAQGGDYGITVRAGNDGSDYGYHISFNNSDINQDTWLYIFKGGGHIYGDIQKQYTVPSGSHDYIVTVKANIITIKVDGATILTKEDNTFVTGGSTSFISGGAQVDITYVKVTQA